MNRLFLLFPILFPIVSSALYYLIKPKSERARRLYLLSSTIITSVSVWLLIIFRPDGALTVYNYSYGLSIKFSIDSLGAFFAGMTSLLWPFAMIYAFSYMEHLEHKRMFFLFYLMTFGVTEGICFSGNLITLYLFYEALTLVTIPLVIHKFDSASMHAGRVYATFSIGGSAFAFIGMVFFALSSGTTDFTPGGVITEASPLMQWAFILMFFGFGVKAAIFPLHSWLPKVSVAPTPVTALLHAVAVVKAGAFALIRVVYSCYGAGTLSGTWVQDVALVAAIFTCIYSSLMALRERHFKRRLAYSTSANLSYIIFGAMLMSKLGLAAALLHMLFHAVSKMVCFLSAGSFMHCTENEYIYELDGIGRKMPWTFAFYTVGALSITGIPPLSGFVSKWQLASAALDLGSAISYFGVAALLIAALLSAIYSLSVSVRAFFPKDGQGLYDNTGVREAPLMMLIPTGVFALAAIVLGFAASPVIELLMNIAGGLVS